MNFSNSLASGKKCKSRRCRYWVRLFVILLVSIGTPIPRDPSASAAPESIVGLQPFLQSSSIEIKNAEGSRGLATLINLNPSINAWYLLLLDRGAAAESYHLENADPKRQRLVLDSRNPYGLAIRHGKESSVCELWAGNSSDNLRQSRKSKVPYAPLCDGKLYLRNPTKGHQTPIEAVTEFLRKEVPGGEELVSFVRDTFFAYRYEKKAEEKVEARPSEPLSQRQPDSGPAPALLDPKESGRSVKPTDLGIEIQEPDPGGGMAPGAWYPAKDNPGIYVSVIVPNLIAPEVMRSHKGVVLDLDSVERVGLVYLVAFDLSLFDLHFTLGTEHPGVGWSSHIPDQMRNQALPGPDGIGTSAPLVRTGLVNPMDVSRTVATFTGGFKRLHGAFKYGPLSLKNHGSHYGFLENGVVFSRLQPELATIYVLNDGSTEMKTWTQKDDDLLPGVKYARQNGVPIIDGISHDTGLSVPGSLVGQWGAGNWSGSEDKKLRTMRAGVGLQEFNKRRFLIYAFFWSATPSAMARVFQAYQCRYAMLLDMNALVHTYLAVYQRTGANLYVQHLIRGMSEVDLTVKGRYIPRFLGYADDRDLFYLTRKEVP